MALPEFAPNTASGPTLELAESTDSAPLETSELPVMLTPLVDTTSPPASTEALPVTMLMLPAGIVTRPLVLTYWHKYYDTRGRHRVILRTWKATEVPCKRVRASALVLLCTRPTITFPVVMADAYTSSATEDADVDTMEVTPPVTNDVPTTFTSPDDTARPPAAMVSPVAAAPDKPPFPRKVIPFAATCARMKKAPRKQAATKYAASNTHGATNLDQ